MVWYNDTLTIPDATDLTDPAQVAVWSAVSEYPGIDQCFNADYLAVFEIEQLHVDKQWAAVNGYSIDGVEKHPMKGEFYGDIHERILEPTDGDTCRMQFERFIEWNHDIAPSAKLPDGRPFEETTHLITYHDGQDMHHPLGMYGVSAANTVPLAVRDVFQHDPWSWWPRVHRVSHAGTFTPRGLLGDDPEDVTLIGEVE